jgi:hypothetical protein
MAAASSSGPRERLSFEYGVTHQVTLDSPGEEQTARDGGVEYRYFLANRKIMWVPESVEMQLGELSADIGDTINITKHKHGRQTIWKVDRVAAETRTEEAVRTAETAPPSRPAPRQQKATAAPATAAPTPAEQEARPTTTPELLPFSNQMYTCMCAAVRVAAGAEKFAAQIGRPLAFETGDIRAMATTLFIQANGGGR